MDKLLVGNEYFYIDSTEAFLVLVQDKRGWDAHDYLEKLLEGEEDDYLPYEQ